MLQGSMNTYVKNICAKYQELEENNMLTTTQGLSIMKVCNEFVKATDSDNPKATLTTDNDYKEEVRLNDLSFN